MRRIPAINKRAVNCYAVFAVNDAIVSVPIVKSLLVAISRRGRKCTVAERTPLDSRIRNHFEVSLLFQFSRPLSVRGFVLQNSETHLIKILYR